jgi:hypothetical protein
MLRRRAISTGARRVFASSICPSRGRISSSPSDDVDLRVPFTRVKVDERLGGAPRRLSLPDGASCEVRDLKALDTLLAVDGAIATDGSIACSDMLQFVLFSLRCVRGARSRGVPLGPAVGGCAGRASSAARHRQDDYPNGT